MAAEAAWALGQIDFCRTQIHTTMPYNEINEFLRSNDLTIDSNPCVSPDFCLDWEALQKDLKDGRGLKAYPKSEFETKGGSWSLVENARGDHAWLLRPGGGSAGVVELEGKVELGDGRLAYPATYENLLSLKNLAQAHDPRCTIFPTAGGNLGKSTLGIGARFTTLHWPGVDWAMATLGLGVTANQNSIPRELVYDVNAMLADELDTVPFPFIGGEVPEGHQGQSVEGMGHGCVLAKLKTGFHRRGIAWSFNADHQPIGGKYDAREDKLVRGCALASYITFDLSPELTATRVPESEEDRKQYVETNIPAERVQAVRAGLDKAGLSMDDGELNELLCSVWPAMVKMRARDDKYRAIREELFSTEVGREYLRELSIDELPGLTTQATTAAMLSLCESMGMKIHFIAPAFGFQKNLPYPDNEELRELVGKQWAVCKQFGVSIGFHSGSGKSAENYRVLGEVTGGALEIKTSGRYTFEMGRALSESRDPSDRRLWLDWHQFTVDLAVSGAFSEQKTEREMARRFILDSLPEVEDEGAVFADEASCRAALEALPPSPENVFWFEYNFLYVLAKGGSHEKSCLGDHSPEGYRQRARFYSISDEGRLLFAKRVAAYIIFLAECTGLVSSAQCAEAKKRLEATDSWEAFLEAIGG